MPPRPAALLAVFLLTMAVWPPGAVAQPAFRFAAFGDMPYCDPRNPAACPGEIARVEKLIGLINAARPAFTFFLGDTKGGGEACTDAIVLDRTASWMALVEGPLVYTPGDNEWTDCWQPRAGGHDPVALLGRIRARFFAAPHSLGRAPMALTRQADGAPDRARYVENARWEHGGVLFLTAHVPGSDNNRPPETGPQPPGAAEEWPTRNAANLAWIAEGFTLAERNGIRALVIALQADIWFRDRCGRGTEAGHADTRRALAEGARRFGRPVLVLHGDSHGLLLDNPVREVRNLMRLMVPGAQDIRAVLVGVDPAAPQPFSVSLLGQDERLGQPPCG